MPIRYIGRDTTYKGKFLFHILCNLKDFGVGRMVIRKSFSERYPEPTFYIIKKSCPDLTHPDLTRGHIIATHVFRGKPFDGDKKITSVYKHDWELVPKADEKNLLDNKLVYEPVEVPAFADMPPLLAKLYTEKLKKQGHEPQPIDTKLFLRVARTKYNRARQPLVEKVEDSLPEDEKKTPITWAEHVAMKKKIRKGEKLHKTTRIT